VAVDPLVAADPAVAPHDDEVSVETVDDDRLDLVARVLVPDAEIVVVVDVVVPVAMHAPRAAVATTLAAPAATLERAAGRRRRREDDVWLLMPAMVHSDGQRAPRRV
jgi:hypothetical protein